MAAAAAASFCRTRAVSAKSISTEPQSPAVMVTMVMWFPAPASKASVPAPRTSTSSGWAWMARTRFMAHHRQDGFGAQTGAEMDPELPACSCVTIDKRALSRREEAIEVLSDVRQACPCNPDARRVGWWQRNEGRHEI